MKLLSLPSMLQRINATVLRSRGGTEALLLAGDEYRESKSLLTNQQSTTLIEYINTLTARGLSPTPTMVRNFVHDIIQSWPSKNWVANWVKLHADELLSKYLLLIDMTRKIADNWH